MPVIFRYTLLHLDRLFFFTVVLLSCAWMPQLQAGEFKKTKCWFQIPMDRDMTCGTLNVPESRKKKNPAEITLSVVVFEPDRVRHEPVVFLTGGPGQTSDIGDAEDIKQWWQFISGQSWMIGRRVVVADQRGIGRSKPNLDCTRYFKADNWNAISFSVDAAVSFDALMKQELIACRNALIAQRIDLSAYNTTENAADIDDLRRALTIEKWVLYGVSYGTRLALEVMNEFPNGISASILDSVLPVDIDYLDEDGPNLDRSLKLLERDCEESRYCRHGLRNTVQVIARELDRQPVLLRSDGKKVRYRYVSGVDFLNLLFGSLYDWGAIPILPELIERTYEHDFRLLADMVFAEDNLEISEGMDFSVTCSENGRPNLPRKRAKYLAKWAEADDYTWACPLWFPQGTPTPKKLPRASNIPTLLLSGEYDPATPPEWAYRAAKTLRHGQVVVFRGIGHDVIDSDLCGSEVVADFLANPMSTLKTKCVAKMEAPQFTAAVEGSWPGVVAQRIAGAGTSSGQARATFRFGHR